MNEIPLEELLAQAENAGVFFVTNSDLEAIELASQHNDAFYGLIDLQHCHSRMVLLQAVAHAMNFPPSFGNNWDALADYLSDLNWLASEAFVLCFANADHYRDAHEEDFNTLIEILEETSTTWSAQNSPFWVFLSLPDAEFENIQIDET